MVPPSVPAACSKLDGNKLSGSLPNEWSGMAGMQYFDIALNQLTGTLPPSWANMKVLKTMWVAAAWGDCYLGDCCLGDCW